MKSKSARRLLGFLGGLLGIVWIHLPDVQAQKTLTQQNSKLLKETLTAEQRPAPTIPAKGEKIRVIIDTDANNEIDDIWAIALALLAPERFEIEGFIAANFEQGWGGGSSSIDLSLREIEAVLEVMGKKGGFPILRGAHPMQYRFEPAEAEGVDFIIEKAMASPEDDPLWVIALGSATNLASAYLKEPEIAEKVVFFWHGRTDWPNRCTNFNVFGDRNAAMALFHCRVPFVLFDTGTHLTCPMEESEREMAPLGALGRYLHDYRHKRKYFRQPGKGFFDLGDIAVLIDPALGEWEVTDCPEVERDLTYRFAGTKGKVLRCKGVDRDGTFALFYEKLREFHRASQ